MKKIKELKYTNLRNDFDSSALDFKDTSEIEPFNRNYRSRKSIKCY